MTTTFTVFSLGNLPVWDTVEGNQTLATGNVDASLGNYGSTADPLFDSRVTLSSAGNGFSGGDPDTYDLDNNVSNDQFSIDGGPPQTFDAAMVFDAVITYRNGSTANISAVVFQDSAGNTYWAPELDDNDDQMAIEFRIITSLELVTPIYANGVNTGYGLIAEREESNPLCFCRGAMIACPDGPRPIESLQSGDWVLTMDNGAQQIRWIGSRRMAALGKFAPIRIRAGILGAQADLEVSPQHRVLLQGSEVERLFAEDQVLAAVKHLVDGDAITIREGGEVEYFHILFDDHQVVWANGVATESLFLGQVGTALLDAGSLEEIRTLFPELEVPEGTRQKLARPALKSYEASLLVPVLRDPWQRAQTAAA